MIGRCLSLCSAVMLALLVFARSVNADRNEIVIGVPEIRVSQSFLTRDSADAYLLRSALAPALVSYDSEEKSARPLLARTVLFDRRSVRVRIVLSDDRRFADDEKIDRRNLMYSFNQCRLRKVFPSGLKYWVKRKGDELEVSLSGLEEQSSLLASLADCPIVSRRAYRIFRDELGRGTNIISSGDYSLERFREGSFVELVPRESDRGQSLRLRAFHETERMLQALRSGSIDLFVTSDQGVRERVLSDETLRLQRCSKYYVALRKGVRLQCDSHVRVANVGYYEPQTKPLLSR